MAVPQNQNLLKQLTPLQTKQNLKKLMLSGFTLKQLMFDSGISNSYWGHPEKFREDIIYFVQAGIHANDLLPYLDCNTIAYNLGILVRGGAQIDANFLVSRLDLYQIGVNLITLLDNGADRNMIIKKIQAYQPKVKPSGTWSSEPAHNMLK